MFGSLFIKRPRSTLSTEREREREREREMGSTTTATRPHVVCVPAPLQGHINPMLKLAKLLHHKGFHVTFVNTEYIHKRLLWSRGPSSLDGLPDFHFETITDGLPPVDADVSQDIIALAESTTKACLLPLCNLISKLNNTSSSNVPPVTCIVADGCMSFTLDAADKFGIPCVLFWTPSACGFLSYMHYRHLVERGLIPLKGIIQIFKFLVFFYYIFLKLTFFFFNITNLYFEERKEN